MRIAFQVHKAMNKLCLKEDELAGIRERHMSTERLCQFFEHGWFEANDCPYYDQKKGSHRVRLYSIFMLPYGDWYHGAGRAVIDPNGAKPMGERIYWLADLRKVAAASANEGLGAAIT